ANSWIKWNIDAIKLAQVIVGLLEQLRVGQHRAGQPDTQLLLDNSWQDLRVEPGRERVAVVQTVVVELPRPPTTVDDVVPTPAGGDRATLLVCGAVATRAVQGKRVGQQR